MGTVVSKALMYAMEKHAGQVYPRKDEEWPYITHPIRVALRVAGLSYDDTIIVVALLHDVLEGTDAAEDDIRARFGEVASAAVSRLSRKEGIAYRDYIRDLTGHPIAYVVKIADLQDNLYHCKTDDAPEHTKSLISRYVWALEYLMGSASDEEVT